ncbi:MAG: aminodeoxychorismate synthase component I [Porphyromonadaceae bacterium]|nr:aminodeoxychorismate synthase component I [Porphyromonadaceae bacterium]
MFLHSDELTERMNKAGQIGKAFLFGIDFEMEESFFLTDPMAQQEILFDFRGRSNVPRRSYKIPSHHFEAFPEDYDTYQSRFETVMDGLKRGDSYLTNLTIRTPVATSLPLRDIFLYARTPYRLFLPGRFVCFSPECFVRMEKGKIFTFPMKGTIDARLPDAAQVILCDTKETAEHNTIVDLMRNDLSRIATGVKVNRFRYIEELHTHNGPILQVSSEIEGELPADYLQQVGTLFFELLPAGSVSGAPKAATLALIRTAEKERRSFYTGVAGYFDGSNLDACVLIRYIEQKDAHHYFSSGGGITAQSDCRKEYDEALRKIYLPF